MIELLVAFVLIGIVLAVAAGTIMGGFSGAAETATSASARAKAAEAADRFGADVRGARSIGRDGAKIVDTSELVRAVTNDSDLFDIEGNRLDWRDVTHAAPDRFTFQSDVVDERAGSRSEPECVSWSIANAGAGWYLRRTTTAYTTRCATAGTVYEDDQMTPPTNAPRPGSAGVPPLFRYVMAQRGGQGCSSNVVSGPLTSAARNRIIGVRMDFRSVVVNRGDASHAALMDEISIRSRTAADYQLALGCDE